MRRDRRSSAGFAGATIPGGRLRKGGEAPLRGINGILDRIHKELRPPS
jgi:hypothetical protein